jgi:hypothetical protein
MTEAVATMPICIVCTYDRRQVSGSIVVAAMRTHPAVILGTTFRANPFYEPAGAGMSGARDVI